MDITCPNCGTLNRNTSRFCARCGEPLAVEEEARPEGEALELPWLQSVQERAVKPTERLSEEQIAESPEETRDPAPMAELTAAEAPQGSTAEEVAAPGGHPEDGAAPAAHPDAASGEDTGRVPGAEGSLDEPPPQWLVSMLEPEAAQEGQPERPDGAGGPEEQPSDSTDGLREGRVAAARNGAAPGTPRAPDAAYEPEELAHVMPWAQQAPPGGTPEVAEVEGHPEGILSVPGLPPWLNDVTVQETLQASAPGAEERLPEPEELGIEGIEPFVPPELQEPSEAQEQAAVGGARAAQRAPEQVPEWLRSLAPDTPAEEVTQEQLIERKTHLSQATLGPSEMVTETVRAAPVPVRPPRPGSVEALAALLQQEAEGVGAQVQRAEGTRIRLAGLEAAPARGRLVQRLLPDGLIYLSVLVVLLGMLTLRPTLGDVNAPPAADVQEFYNAIEAAPTDRLVLVVYDWDASRSAEMSALAQAVMHHLMSRRLPFVTVSTTPQGPGFAQQIAFSVAQDPRANYGYEYGRDFLVMGYLPGSEAALRAMISDFRTALPLDYVRRASLDSYPLAQRNNFRGIGDFALIIDLAAEEAALRNWIEQASAAGPAGGPEGERAPMIAAVPQGLAPVARPYRDVPGAGLDAVVSGPAGAMQYSRQLALQGRVPGSSGEMAALSDRLNAQSAAQLLVALAIAGALVRMAMGRVLRRT